MKEPEQVSRSKSTIKDVKKAESPMRLGFGLFDKEATDSIAI